MKRYQKINNIIGWISFIIAAATYILTIEPTTSLWDCGEFIASAYKLEVGHPPGAPFFMLIARFFSLFASDLSMVASMVNTMSALASAFTILFLFWTITHLARKIFIKNEGEVTRSNVIIVMGAGLVGALAYTFSDSFWFSAVEGEVYASSSLFTAVVFWAILKWENAAGEKYADRWLVLIAYLMGLSIGVHLLNLLAIPSIVLVIYFKKFKVSRKGVFYAMLLACAILGFVMYGIIQGLVKFASWFELLFVNGFGLPFNSGVIFYFLLIISALVYGIYFSIKNQKVILNTIMLCLTVILIGYSSFALIVIRSIADPPLDENDPSNIFSLLSYLNREQYGERPLMFGQYYNAPILGSKEGETMYLPIGDKYEATGHKISYEYDKRFTTIFPRMYSSSGEHVNLYEKYVNKNRRGIVTDMGSDGEPRSIVKPTFFENMWYFFDYQVGYMYLRYFMWNFSGRQNDIQGEGTVFNGNWLSGIKFIDNLRLGPQDKIPDSAKKHKARNIYYMLPLLLGILGMIFQLEKNKNDFWIVLSLFIMTGLAIIVYLNQTPFQPRERDYAYAGSFYAFCIWIGIGICYFYERILKKINKPVAVAGGVVVLSLLAVPALMAKENWDDHNRSGRYTALSLAYNYLNSCAPNALLFTNGDNDTFPLWYAQEVEGIRTDVRVVNLMLLNTDWYIDQMNRKAYTSDRLPISIPREKYIQGRREYLPLIERVKTFVDLKDVVEFACTDSPEATVSTQGGESVNYIPTKMFRLAVDTAKVIANGTVKPYDKDKIENEILWKIDKRHLYKSDFVVMDILANNKWERPIYFVSLGHSGTLGLENYMQLEGFAYRLIPIKTQNGGYLETGRIDTDIMYDNMMNKFKWGRMNEPDVYLDHFHQRTLAVIRFRNNFARLANALYKENKPDSAMKVLDRCMELTPPDKYPYDFYMLQIIEEYLHLKAFDKADKIISDYVNECRQELNFISSLRGNLKPQANYELQKNLQITSNLLMLCNRYDRTKLQEEIEMLLRPYSDYFRER